MIPWWVWILGIVFVVTDIIAYAAAPYPERSRSIYSLIPGGGIVAWLRLRHKGRP